MMITPGLQDLKVRLRFLTATFAHSDYVRVRSFFIYLYNLGRSRR